MNESTTMDRPKRMASNDWAENCVCPPANIFSKGDDYIVEMEMPGVRKEGLDITVEGNELSVTGRPASTEMPGEPIYCESSGGRFSRSFELSNDVDVTKIQAELRDGVLRLRLPKSEKVRPRKISIQG
jgi:HSP20 family protein